MKSLHITTAVLELGAGLALLLFPSDFALLVIGGVLDTPVALTVARVGASGLIALGLACWISRADATSLATLALVTAMLFYNFAVVAILAYASFGLHLRGVALWPVVIAHIGMGIWCGASLRGAAKT